MEIGCKDKYNCCSNSRIYEDFVPTSELVHGKDYDILLLNLAGFKKEEIKIELSKTGILKISGQRPVNKFLSFEKDILVSTNCDKSKINAKLLNGILYVKHPKLIISSEKNENKLPSSTNNEPKQDKKKPEPDELNEQDNAEHSPPKQEQPKNHEQTQVVKPDESMKDATTPSASDLAKLKVSRKVMNFALATLVVLGIGRCCFVNMMSSSKKAKE